MLVTALKYEEVRMLQIEDERVVHEEVILKGQGRVRDVSTGPDGAIYVGEIGNPPNWGEYGKAWYGLERMRWVWEILPTLRLRRRMAVR